MIIKLYQNWFIWKDKEMQLEYRVGWLDNKNP